MICQLTECLKLAFAVTSKVDSFATQFRKACISGTNLATSAFNYESELTNSAFAMFDGASLICFHPEHHVYGQKSKDIMC